MAHIHTSPGQHDITVSAYIVRLEKEPLCLVHMHKKIDKLMQIGGHMELDETPWQAVEHEVLEESGYTLDELEVVQPVAEMLTTKDAVIHPVAFAINTHDVGNGHFHSDLCFGFVATAVPAESVSLQESEDLRWLTLAELQTLATSGHALGDIVDIYGYLLDRLSSYARIPARDFSTKKPERGITYNR